MTEGIRERILGEGVRKRTESQEQRSGHSYIETSENEKEKQRMRKNQENWWPKNYQASEVSDKPKEESASRKNNS